MNGNNVFSNLLWRFSERIGAKLISVIVNLILARILAPELYGTVTIVLVFTEILQVFVESGFGTALIQKKDADDLDFSSVFFFNLAISVVLYALLFAAAPMIARLYRKPELLQVVRVVGLILIIAGVRNVQQAYVSRNMLFKRFFFATLGGTITAAIVGIGMAVKGFGVWAYVTQYLLNNLVGTLILWFTVKWRPKLQFSPERLKGLFSYGWKLLVSSVLNIVSDKLRPLIIGYRFSASDLSFYNEGILFPNLIVDNVNSSIDSVLLPALSQQQDSSENVKAMTRRAIQISSYIMWPLMIGLFVCARPLVSLLLGEEWLPCVPFLRIFSLYYALFPIHTANLNAIKAMGRSDIFLKLEVAKRILDLAFVVGTIFIGVKAMAFGLLTEGFLCLFINAFPNKRLCGYAFTEQMKDIFPAFLLSAAMGAAVYALSLLGLGNLVTLVLQVLLGAVIYVGVSALLKLEPFRYLLGIAGKLLKRGN
ncbi:MAG: lipopolysaccharide biosynthesis protein [Oscillospiraceae bacterium]|nr:lipopolysaccharide biosynthesis protein [Oscillospiraceae bacterium]